MNRLATASKSALRRTVRRLGYDVVRARVPQDPCEAIRQLAAPAPLRVVLDVGANIGQTALRYVREFPGARIYSIEPFPQACALLRASTRPFPQVTPCELALGPADTTMTLFVNSSSQTNSLLPNAPETARYSDEGATDPLGVVAVPVRRLDTFCRERELERIDLLKIDAQGYELSILDGAGALLDPAYTRLLYLEVTLVPLYQGQAHFDQVVARLRRHGYKLYELYEKKTHADTGVMWANGLFRPA